MFLSRTVRKSKLIAKYFIFSPVRSLSRADYKFPQDWDPLSLETQLWIQLHLGEWIE